MRFQAGATWADLGLSTAHLRRDLGLGAVALLASITPIWLLQNVKLRRIGFTYKQHIIEAIQDQAGLTTTFICDGGGSLGGAPIFEEFCVPRLAARMV